MVKPSQLWQLAMARVCCRDCGKVLTEENRVMKSVSKKGKIYYLNRCKPCITEAELLLRTLKKQHPQPATGTQKCGCCGRIDKLFLDHDHSTKEFRGWICRNCNSGIGLLGDCPDGLRQALVYLERTRSLSRSRNPSDNKNPDDTSHKGHSRESAQSVEMASSRSCDEQSRSEDVRANR